MREPHRRPEAEPRSPDLEVMSASDVRQNFGSVVNRVARGEGRVLIEKHGSPAVGIVSIEDIRRLRQMDEVTSRRKRMLEAMRAPFRDVPTEELVREAEAAAAEVRDERNDGDNKDKWRRMLARPVFRDENRAGCQCAGIGDRHR